MRALSVLQPWASLLAIGAKVYETRTWGTTYRGPLAIHSCAKPAAAIAEEPEFYEVLQGRRLYAWNLPRGAVVAVADLVQCLQVDVEGSVNGVRLCRMERMFGNFQPGRFAWQLANPRLLSLPASVRGRQGLWEWHAPEDLEQLLTLKTPAELTA
jgi:activating signal cointegrator 1